VLAVLFALAAAVSFGGLDYTAGLAARETSVLRVTVAAEVINAALVMSVVPFVSSQLPLVPSLGWGAAAGVGGVAGVMALYLGFRYAAWPRRYGRLAARIRHALGWRMLQLEHVGSTAVPGLAAKPVIDIDLTVADPGREQDYVPALDGRRWRS
jgi:GrpB protein